jgi:SAM-dependent methyltransferase
MSSYQDYSEASQSYDETREAVGAEIIIGALSLGRVPLADTELLDAGCGTGSYAALLAPHVRGVTLVDANEGMLTVAREKLAGLEASAFSEGTLQHLPFDDNTFDAVMTNQVLHHLGDEAGGAWLEHDQVFSEYRRVLRPGGTLVLNTCAQVQMRDGYWFYSLIPRAAEAMRDRYAPLAVVESLLAANGLTVTGTFVPSDATIQGASYFDVHGPLSDSWRLGDSTWTLSPEDEINAMLTKVELLRDQGSLDTYFRDHDARRAEVGQITFVVARAEP